VVGSVRRDDDRSDGDYNDDGWVDGLDYLVWAASFGMHNEVVVPEPGCGLLLQYFSRLKTEPPRAFCSGQTARCGSVLGRLGYNGVRGVFGSAVLSRLN
jgi:hypothetical protein